MMLVWVLPLGAILALSLGALVPLVLKPGTDAFNAATNGMEMKWRVKRPHTDM